MGDQESKARGSLFKGGRGEVNGMEFWRKSEWEKKGTTGGEFNSGESQYPETKK